MEEVYIAGIKNGVVERVAVFHSFEFAQEFAPRVGWDTVVDVTNIPVTAGDTYDGENFYRDGVLVEPYLEPAPYDELGDAMNALRIIYGDTIPEEVPSE